MDAWWREPRVILQRCDDLLAVDGTSAGQRSSRMVRRDCSETSDERSSSGLEYELSDDSTIEHFDVSSDDGVMQTELVVQHLNDARRREPTVVLERCDVNAPECEQSFCQSSLEPCQERTSSCLKQPPCINKYSAVREPRVLLERCDTSTNAGQGSSRQDLSGPSDGHAGSDLNQPPSAYNYTAERELRVVLESCDNSVRECNVNRGKRSLRLDSSGPYEEQTSFILKSPRANSVATASCEFPSAAALGAEYAKCILCNEIFSSHKSKRTKSLSILLNLACGPCLNKCSTDSAVYRIRRELKMRAMQCFKCEQTFDSSTELEIHEKSHYVRCENCAQCFKSKMGLQLHIDSKHIANEKYQCDICSYSTARPGSLTSHMLIHTQSVCYKCPVCGEAFMGKLFLNRHMKRTHVFACDVCPYKASTEQILRHHLQTHTDEKPYECEFCLKLFRNKSSRRVHFKQVHSGVKKYSCSICSYRAFHRGGLKQHLMTHAGEKPISCTLCSYSASRKEHLIVHMRTHTGSKPFKCDQCNYASTTSCGLKFHKFKHGKEKPLKCELCAFQSARISHLRRHEETHNWEYKCKLCSMSFKTEGRLAAHVNSHVQTGNPRQCSVCDKSFTTKRVAELHRLNVHCGQKLFLKYKCHLCSYETDSGTKLACHINTHTGEKPYGCDLCSRAFTQNSHLTVHKKTVHEEEKSFKCTKCSASYWRKGLLKRHVKRYCISLQH